MLGAICYAYCALPAYGKIEKVGYIVRQKGHGFTNFYLRLLGYNQLVDCKQEELQKLIDNKKIVEVEPFALSQLESKNRNIYVDSRFNIFVGELPEKKSAQTGVREVRKIGKVPVDWDL